jgi:periplasmic copper chaperone A
MSAVALFGQSGLRLRLSIGLEPQPLALSEDTMRVLLQFIRMTLLIAASSFAFAQSAFIEQPWSRATPAGARTGAVYLTVTNKSHDADRLLGVSSDVADKSQIHEMKVVNGTMEMREVSTGLPVPAGGSVVLKPGSSHVMLIGLKKPLTAGETIPLTLDFEKAGKVSITVPVRSMGAAHDDMPGMGHMDKK